MSRTLKPMIHDSTFVALTNVERDWDLLKGCCDLLNTHLTYAEQHVKQYFGGNFEMAEEEMSSLVCAASVVAVIMKH